MRRCICGARWSGFDRDAAWTLWAEAEWRHHHGAEPDTDYHTRGRPERRHRWTREE